MSMSDHPVRIDAGAWLSGPCLPEDARVTLARELLAEDGSIPAILSTHEARQLLTRYQLRMAGLIAVIDGG